MKTGKQKIKPTRRLTTITFILLLLFSACNTQKYIWDSGSATRQKEIKKIRASNLSSEIVTGIASLFAAAAFDSNMDWIPADQLFKKLKLVNPTRDTMYVNMLTDVFWDEENYCDFMDIRIPPRQNCKIRVPVNTNYNLYFSNTPENDDDEMLEIGTGEIKKITLQPGLTLIKDTVNLNQ